MSKIRVAIHGAAGRMGQRLIALGLSDDNVDLVAAIDSAEHPQIGSDAGELAGCSAIGIPLADALHVEADVVIDFSIPDAAEAIARSCRDSKTPLVIATTGFSDRQKSLLQDISSSIPMVLAPSMSLAVNLTMKLVAQAAAALREFPGGADAEIIERHHRFKEDAPSGTALKFGELIQSGMGQTKETHGREGRPGARPRDEIGYHALRVGDNTGEHTIVFGLLGETIELSVKSTNRDCYALGALAAAKFVVDKPPKTYNMYDVLGL